MYTSALASFLFHCLVLLIIINFFGGIIIMYDSENIFNYFTNNDLLVLDETKPQYAVFLAVDAVTLIIHGYGLLLMGASFMGILGVLYFSKYPIINFSVSKKKLNFIVNISLLKAGFCLITMSLLQFGSIAATKFLQESIETIILKDLLILFETSAGAVDSALEEYKGADLGTSPENPKDEGWGIVAQGSKLNHTKIDYYQLNNECCGISGRHSWIYLVPTSCCPDDYSFNNCTFAAAFTKNCKHPYNQLMASLTSLQVILLVFGFLSVLAGVSALCLARIKKMYPDDNYGSDTWSSSDSEDD